MSAKDLQYYKSLNYNIIVQREELDGDVWFVAYCAEFGKDACHGIGSAETEAIESFKVEKDFFIEYLYKEGIEIPSPENDDTSNYSGVFTVRTTPWLHHQLVKQSKNQGVSLNSYINQIISYNLGYKMALNQSIDVMKELRNDTHDTFMEFLERTNSIIYDMNEITNSLPKSSRSELHKKVYLKAS